MSDVWKRRMALFAVAVAGNSIYLLPYIQYTFYERMRVAMDVSNSQFGTLLLVYSLVGMFTCWIGGGISDRYNNRNLMICCLGVQFLLNVWYALVPSYVVAIIVWIGLGFTAGFIFWPCLQRALTRIAVPEKRGMIYGWYYTLNGLVGVAFGAVAVAMANKYTEEVTGLRYGLLVVAATNIIAIICLLLFYNDDLGEVEPIKEEDKFKWSDFKKVAKTPWPWLLGIIGFLCYTVYSCENSYFNPYLINVRGIEPAASELLGTIRAYGLTFMGIIGGYIADKIFKSTTKHMMVIYGFVIAAYLGLFLFPLSDSGAAVYTVIVTAIVMTVYTVRYSQTREMAIKPQFIATTIGIASFFTWAPDVINPPILGAIIDKYGAQGYNIIFGYLTVCSVLIIVLCGVVLRLNKKEQAKAQAEAEQAKAE